MTDKVTDEEIAAVLRRMADGWLKLQTAHMGGMATVRITLRPDADGAVLCLTVGAEYVEREEE